jgi:hypothetical protein
MSSSAPHRARRHVNGGLRRSGKVWAMDFVHDQLATGVKLRILTVIDIGQCLLTTMERVPGRALILD